MSAASPEVEHVVQVRWQDLDGLGHVNHAVVLTYLEEGRDVFLAEHGIGRDEYVVGRCTVNFNGEIAPGQREVAVRCSAVELGTKSITTAERILGPGGEAIVEAAFSLVMWDPGRRETRPISDAERASLQPKEVASR